jgi:hypothetical protein
MWVYGERPHVAIHYFLPGPTGILSTIAAVEGDTYKNDLGPFSAPGQTFDGAAGEEPPQRSHRSVASLHNSQAVVKRNEKAQCFIHKLLLMNNLLC